MSTGEKTKAMVLLIASVKDELYHRLLRTVWSQQWGAQTKNSTETEALICIKAYDLNIMFQREDTAIQGHILQEAGVCGASS